MAWAIMLRALMRRRAMAGVMEAGRAMVADGARTKRRFGSDTIEGGDPARAIAAAVLCAVLLPQDGAVAGVPLGDGEDEGL